MRRLAALFCVVFGLFSTASQALDLNSTYYGVYEKPGSNGQTIVYIVPKPSVLILASEPITPITFMPQYPGFTAIVAADGSFGSLTQISYKSTDMLALGATASSYKLFGGDFDGDSKADFFLQGSGNRSSVVIATDYATGGAAIYYSFGNSLNSAQVAVSVSDVDGNGRTDIAAGANTYLSSSYGAWFEDASSGGSAGGSMTLAVGSTQGSFKVDESGAATYNIPIVAVPGTAGVTPQISLNYSSQGGSGAIGKGWSVGGLSAISRCRQTRHQDNSAKAITWTDQDRFCLDGQRLVVTSGAYGANNSTYNTEIDSHIKVTAVGGEAGNPNYFIIQRKDGSKSYYGVDTSSLGNDAKINNPNEKTLTWALRRFEDSVGNPIYFVYHNDAKGQRIKEVRYAYGVNRSNPGGNAARIEFIYDAADRFDKRSSFVAGFPFVDSAKLLSINSVNAGSVVRTYKMAYLDTNARSNKTTRLESVQECVGSTCFAPSKFEWAADYVGFSDSPSGSSALNLQSDQGVSDSVFADINGDGCTDMVAMVTDYDIDNDSDDDVQYYLSNCSSFSRGLFTDGSNFLRFNGSGGKVKALDYNGDGRADILVWHSNWGTWRVLLSEPQSDGSWRLSKTAIDTGVNSKWLSLADLNSDGMTDMLYIQEVSGTPMYSRFLQLDPGQPVNSPRRYQFGPAQPWSSNVEMVSSVGTPIASSDGMDFNGDGLVDLFRNGVNGSISADGTSVPWSWAGALALSTESRQAILFAGSTSGNDTSGSFINASFADFNQDGLTDSFSAASYLNPNGSSFAVHFSTGVGVQPGGNISGLDYDQITLTDVNGDGFSDLLSVGWNQGPVLKRAIWNPQSQVFGAVEIIKNLAQNESHQFSDVTGDGVVDYIKINHDTIDIFPGSGANQPRNVITKITNGLGAETKVSYDDLAKSSHYDRVSFGYSITPKTCSATIFGNPFTFDCSEHFVDANGFYTALNGDWPLPAGTETLGKNPNAPVLEMMAPIYVVARVEGSAPQTASTAMGGMDFNKFSAISYYYSEAKIQASGRGMLGFQKLTTLDEQSGVRTTTTYRQDFPFIGSPLRTEVYTMDAAGNKRFVRTANSKWGFQNYGNGHAAAPYRVVLKETQEFVYDPIALVGVQTRTDTANTYDAFGNVTNILMKTYAGDGSQLIATRETRNQYQAFAGYDFDTGRLLRTEVIDSRPGLYPATRTSAFEYIGIGSSSCYGTAEQAGLLCKEIIEPGDADYELTTTHEYDTFGNRQKSTTTGAGISTRYTRWEYDPVGRYRDRTFNSKDIKVEEVTSRNNLGQPLMVSAINGVRAEFRYTTFGRQYYKSANDGSWSKTLRYTSLPDCPAGTAMADVTTQAGGGRSVSCHDKLARVIHTANALLNNSVAYVDTEYDNVGRVKFVSEPYFPGQRDKFIANKYDILGRVIETRNADGTIVTRSYSGLTTTITDELYRNKIETRNALGELVTVTDALGGAIDYTYYPNGLLWTTTTRSNDAAPGVPTAITTTLEYDKVGRKTKMTDPDKGVWTYTYYVNGELKTQVDAKSQTSTMQYDVLGRMVSRIDCTNSSTNCIIGTKQGNTTWQYFDDTSVSNPRSWLETVADSVTGYSKLHQYDALGRINSTMTTLGSDGTYVEGVAYDSYGRVSRTYDAAGPSSGIENIYDAYSGALFGVKDIASGVEQNRILDINAKGQVLREMVGMTTINRSFQPGTSRLKTIDSYYLNTQIQKLSYDYDAVGNLISRWDQSSSKNVMEVLEYDALNRLKNSWVSGPSLVGVTTAVQYDGFGNIRNKGGVAYEYAVNAGPHAATKIGGVNFTYDANGSNTASGDGRQITYSVFDKPFTIAKGGHSSQFAYDPSRSVYKRLDTTSGGQSTKIINVGSVEFVTLPGGAQEIRRMLPGGIQIAYTNGQLSQPVRRHLLKDHIGSIDIIVNDSGVIEQGMSFDAWGLRRTILQTTNLWQPFDVAGLATFNHVRTTKGYTGHEMLDEVGVIHMGGRIYDPRIGRFLQADPVLQAPTFTQNYNRYSYVVNNPLTLTDPSGYRYTWLDDGGGVGQIIMTAAAIVANVMCEGCAWQTFAAINAGFGAANAAMNGGNIATGAFTGAVMGGLGGYLGVGGWTDWEYVTYAVAGGITTSLQGGNFGNGFVVAGLSTWGASNFAAATGLNNVPGGQIVSRAIVGGTASALTNGKFANGAAFSAFVAAVSAGLSELDYVPGGDVSCSPVPCAGAASEPVYIYNRAAANASSESMFKDLVKVPAFGASMAIAPELLILKGIGIIGRGIKGVRLIDDLASLRGANISEVEKLADAKYLEMGWTKKPLKDGNGVRYFDNKGNSLQLNRGYEGGGEMHGGPYIKATQGSEKIRIPLEGNPAL